MSEPFISELRLQNFKCYEDLTLQLKAGVNLLYGVNGSGKTSVLEGLCIASAQFLQKFPTLHPSSKVLIHTEQVRLATQMGMRDPEYQFPASLFATGNILFRPAHWGYVIHESRFEGISESGTHSKLGQFRISEISAQGAQIAQNGKKEVLPIIAYFSTERLFVSQHKDAPRPIGRSLGYFNALENSNIHHLIRDWLKDAEFLQYQRRESDRSYIDTGLEGMKKLVLSQFDGEWERLFYYEPAVNSGLPKGLFLVPTDKTKTTIPESNLSDGYRNFIWLLLEIAWRCYILNPYLGENAAAETNGIVMIDEVDLHMHPKWQQKIISVLAKAFPKIQFVITTHSPIVLGSVKEGQVILLEGQTASAVPAPFGLTPSYILESYMGIQERLPELQEHIRRYFEMINQGVGRNEEALAIRNRLESILSPNDPIFAEADAMLFYLA